MTGFNHVVGQRNLMWCKKLVAIAAWAEPLTAVLSKS